MVYDDAGFLYIDVFNSDILQSAVFKFDAFGQPDLSFGTNGKLVMPNDQFIKFIHIHDGSLYLLGRKINTENGFNDCDLLLAKYHLDGTPDVNFGTNGTYVELGNPYLESGEGLLFAADGGIVVVGETNEPGLHRPFAVRYVEQALSTPNFETEVVSFLNPLADLLTVHGKGISQITLYGLDGRQAGFGYGNSISTSGLASGLYVGEVVFENGRIVNIKIFKR